MLPGQMMNLPLTITTIMDFAERVHGDSEIVSITADNPAHRYTYADAFKRTRQLANALQKAGVTQGDRVATLAWNDYRHFELYYAISCSGAVCHTINPRLFPDQLEYIVNHAQDKLIFTDPAYGVTPEARELDYQGVYRIDVQSGELDLLIDDFDKPNGLAFSPDEQALYIADTQFDNIIFVGYLAFQSQ